MMAKIDTEINCLIRMDNKIVQKSGFPFSPSENTGADGAILPIRWGVFHLEDDKKRDQSQVAAA
jgi:hypothetical protein